MSEAEAKDGDREETPWDDPNVKDALKSGRDTTDILLMDCPACGVPGYYNNGSHFSCRVCGASYAVITDDEDPPVDRPYIVLGEEYTLCDYTDAEMHFDGEGPP